MDATSSDSEKTPPKRVAKSLFSVRKNAFSARKLLVAGLLCLLGFLFCLGFYLHALANKPTPSEGVLSRTEGRFMAIDASTQRGTSFVVEERDSGKLLKFSATAGYTRLQGDLRKAIGRNIVVRHYDRAVVACWVEGVEYCARLCASKYECELKLYRASVSTLEKTLYTMFALAVICLVASLMRKRQERRQQP